MIKPVNTATVNLWGQFVGAVTWLNDQGYAVFEYDRKFLKSGLDISPVKMSLEEARRGDGTFMFPELGKTYFGLPGLLANVLPDKYGKDIIDSWLLRNGRDPQGFNPVERLCYIGTRGMGALEFQPQITPGDKFNKAIPIEVSELIQLAQEVINTRSKFAVNVTGSEKENSEAMLDILRVGTSAGGAKPKAIIAMNDTGHVISGQGKVPEGYEHWMLKFDGVSQDHPDKFGQPMMEGRMEYAYYLMAKTAGVDMTKCRLLEENGRAHFLTKRFDRKNGQKIHMQSLCGLAHYDWNPVGSHGYEKIFGTLRDLNLGMSEKKEQYRRMVFNIATRNADDHTKNVSFLMDKIGNWSLSPAYDITFSYNPGGKRTGAHQMSINGKRGDFTYDDLLFVARSVEIPKPSEIIAEVLDAVSKWPMFARKAGVNQKIINQIAPLLMTDRTLKGAKINKNIEITKNTIFELKGKFIPIQLDTKMKVYTRIKNDDNQSCVTGYDLHVEPKAGFKTKASAERAAKRAWGDDIKINHVKSHNQYILVKNKQNDKIAVGDILFHKNKKLKTNYFVLEEGLLGSHLGANTISTIEQKLQDGDYSQVSVLPQQYEKIIDNEYYKKMAKTYNAKFVLADKKGNVCLSKTIPAKYCPKSITGDKGGTENFIYINKLDRPVQSFWQIGNKQNNTLSPGDPKHDLKIWQKLNKTEKDDTRLKNKTVHRMSY